MIWPYVRILGFILLPYGSKNGEQLTLRQATKSYGLHSKKIKDFLCKPPYSRGHPIFSLLMVSLHPKRIMNTSGARPCLLGDSHILVGTSLGLC